MVPASFVSGTGIAPSSLSIASGTMDASYTTAFNPVDAAQALWFVSPDAPQLGGPAGLGGVDTFFFSGGDEIASDSVLASVAEPTSLLVLAGGIAGLGLVRGRRRAD